MIDTNLYGAITELKCKTYFLELGYLTSTPDTPSRYDFILDTGDRLLKIQVKSCHFTDGKIIFKTESSHITSNGSNRRSYEDEIDYFCGNELVCPFHTCASWAPKEEESKENEDNYCRW